MVNGLYIYRLLVFHVPWVVWKGIAMAYLKLSRKTFECCGNMLRVNALDKSHYNPIEEIKYSNSTYNLDCLGKNIFRVQYGMVNGLLVF